MLARVLLGRIGLAESSLRLGLACQATRALDSLQGLPRGPPFVAMFAQGLQTVPSGVERRTIPEERAGLCQGQGPRCGGVAARRPLDIKGQRDIQQVRWRDEIA